MHRNDNNADTDTDLQHLRLLAIASLVGLAAWWYANQWVDLYAACCM